MGFDVWALISVVILAFEILLIGVVFIYSRQKKRFHFDELFGITSAFANSFVLHLAAYLYNAIALGEPTHWLWIILGCIESALKLFVGEANQTIIEAFASENTYFLIAYFLGVIIALATTIITAWEIFSSSIFNHRRLWKLLRKDVCDIVIGNTPASLHYAQNYKAILLPGDPVDRDAVKELIENGYAVLRQEFTSKLLASHKFNKKTQYNIICPEEEKSFNCIETFIRYKKEEKEKKNFHLYVALEGEKAEALRREIVEKNKLEAYVDTFCTNELLARTFVEENPVTKYLPGDFIENAAIKPGVKINVFILGFGKFGKELYRQSVMNNQLVTFDGEYKVFPINYYLCDTNIDKDEWNINGLREVLKELKAEEYFPLPELPFNTKVISAPSGSRKVFEAIEKQVETKNSFSLIIVDTDEDFHNIEVGAKLKTKLLDCKNYHLFIRSETLYTENDRTVTYFGNSENVITHDVIVNESLSKMAKLLNEDYVRKNADDEEKARQDFNQYIREKAEDEWKKMNYFTLYSNIYLAVSLRIKLHLLGLDYVDDGKGENTDLIKKRCGYTENRNYSEYATSSVSNAILAQEHARWNAYHLLNEYLPLPKEKISHEEDGKKSFKVKFPDAKKHACLTTHKGLSQLSEYLAQKAANGTTAADYNYYANDEMLVSVAGDLLASFKHSVIEK